MLDIDMEWIESVIPISIPNVFIIPPPSHPISPVLSFVPMRLILPSFLGTFCAGAAERGRVEWRTEEGDGLSGLCCDVFFLFPSPPCSSCYALQLADDAYGVVHGGVLIANLFSRHPFPAALSYPTSLHLCECRALPTLSSSTLLLHRVELIG